MDPRGVEPPALHTSETHLSWMQSHYGCTRRFPSALVSVRLPVFLIGVPETPYEPMCPISQPDWRLFSYKDATDSTGSDPITRACVETSKNTRWIRRGIEPLIG